MRSSIAAESGKPAPGVIEKEIEAQARDLGFDHVGIAPAETPQKNRDALRSFVKAGRHGDMTWLADRLEQRATPKALWPEAQSVIMLAMNYGPSTDPRAILEKKDRGAISVYAQNKDYHDIIKKREKRLARWLIEKYGGELKVFVDTAPVMEKPLAQQAGLGWQGKHTNLVSRVGGSWFFLGAIYTTLTLAAGEPESDHCGLCTNCLDICPTAAFPAPYQLDARRCISYLTIEHKGPIPLEFRAAIGNRIYGCDDCLAVCPWNKFAREASETAFHARDALREPSLKQLLALDDAGFRAFFSGSPIKRIGRNRFVRNVLIAAGNSHDIALAGDVKPLLVDASPLVRGAAVWALCMLLPADDFIALNTKHAFGERDTSVLQEWRTALGIIPPPEPAKTGASR